MSEPSKSESESAVTIARLEAKLAEYEKSKPRLQGLLSSFRMQVAGAVAVIIGVLNEAGIDMSDQGKTYLTIGVAAFGALLIYSDTHRKIGV